MSSKFDAIVFANNLQFIALTLIQTFQRSSLPYSLIPIGEVLRVVKIARVYEAECGLRQFFVPFGDSGWFTLSPSGDAFRERRPVVIVQWVGSLRCTTIRESSQRNIIEGVILQCRIFVDSENLLECWQGRLSHVQRADEVVITAVMIMMISKNKK